MGLDVEMGNDDEAACDCCGHTTRALSGFVHDHDAQCTVAAYAVRWTQNHLATQGASLTVIVGAWGDASSPADRQIVTLKYGFTDDGAVAFTVLDGTPTELTEREVGRTMLRADVIGTPLAKQTFDVLDTVWLTDTRLTELTERDNWYGPPR